MERSKEVLDSENVLEDFSTPPFAEIEGLVTDDTEGTPMVGWTVEPTGPGTIGGKHFTVIQVSCP